MLRISANESKQLFITFSAGQSKNICHYMKSKWILITKGFIYWAKNVGFVYSFIYIYVIFIDRGCIVVEWFTLLPHKRRRSWA